MNVFTSNQENFQTNSSIQNIKTREKHHLQRPHAKLFSFQKSIFYAATKLFKSFPPTVTMLQNGQAKFRAAFTK